MNEPTSHALLLLASHPSDAAQLGLTREFEQIEEELMKTTFREHFDLKKKFEVKAYRIPELISRHKPSIVHFSGHGNKSGELTFLSADGQPISHVNDPVVKIFAAFEGCVRCVVLNTCYSKELAQQIADYVDIVIGMDGKVADEVATMFSTAFYQALGNGETISRAFDLAKLRGPLHGFSDGGGKAILYTREKNNAQRRFVPGFGSSQDIEQDTASRSVAVSKFLRVYPVRRSQIMWLLGAGASAASGIPTAGQMVWDFKRTLLCSSEKRPRALVQDLASEQVRDQLQAFIDRTGQHPSRDSDEEYAHFFSHTYPRAGDRRQYIEQVSADGSPSYGYRAITELVNLGHCTTIWSTNFDQLLESTYKSHGQAAGHPQVIGPHNSELAFPSLGDPSKPTYIKLHGDFSIGPLATASVATRDGDRELRRALASSVRSHGLAVVGYSGRDESIMDTLLAAAREPGAFPAGLYWFHRVGESVSAKVLRLIDLARGNGAQAYLVEIGTFDELMADCLVQFPDVPEALHDELGRSRRRRGASPVPGVGANHWPVLRLNALRVFEWPRTCRLVDCEIGGTREVREAVEHAGVDVLAARCRAGVLAFGEDAEVRSAFSPFSISRFDLHDIDVHKLRYESAEQGLLYEAICAALTRNLPLRDIRRRRRRILVVQRESGERDKIAAIAEVTGSLGGTIRGTSVAWFEAAEIQLVYKLNRLWLNILPTVYAPRSETPSEEEQRRAFVREELAKRYNDKTNDLIDAWSQVLSGGGPNPLSYSMFGALSEGINATFSVGHKTGFSWRQYGD